MLKNAKNSCLNAYFPSAETPMRTSWQDHLQGKITRGGGKGLEGAALHVCVALPSQIRLLCLVVPPFTCGSVWNPL